MKKSELFEKTLGVPLTDLGLMREEFDLIDSLGLVHQETMGRMFGMAPWEVEAWACSGALVDARKHKDKELHDEIAAWLGFLLAEQLMNGDYAAPRKLSEILMDTFAGKTPKGGKGRKLSENHFSVLFAFKYLKRKLGIENPTQVDVRRYLASKGISVSKDQMSKIFDAAGLKNDSGDARTAKSRSRRKV